MPFKTARASWGREPQHLLRHASYGVALDWAAFVPLAAGGVAASWACRAATADISWGDAGVASVYVVDVHTVTPALFPAAVGGVAASSACCAATADISWGDAGVASVYVVDVKTVASEDVADALPVDDEPLSANASAVAKPHSAVVTSPRMSSRRRNIDPNRTRGP